LNQYFFYIIRKIVPQERAFKFNAPLSKSCIYTAQMETSFVPSFITIHTLIKLEIVTKNLG